MTEISLGGSQFRRDPFAENLMAWTSIRELVPMGFFRPDPRKSSRHCRDKALVSRLRMLDDARKTYPESEFVSECRHPRSQVHGVIQARKHMVLSQERKGWNNGKE